MVEREAGPVIVRGILVVASLLVAGCNRGERAPVEGTAPVRSSSPFAGLSPAGNRSSLDEDSQQAACCPRFRDVHEEANLGHVYVNGEAGECLFMETTGAGAGWLDFDADGHWDLYLNQGGDATIAANERQPKDRLFRNLGDGTFEDVTEEAGIAEYGYSQAVAVGDYDNDGFDDGQPGDSSWMNPLSSRPVDLRKARSLVWRRDRPRFGFGFWDGEEHWGGSPRRRSSRSDFLVRRLPCLTILRR